MSKILIVKTQKEVSSGEEIRMMCKLRQINKEEIIGVVGYNGYGEETSGQKLH